MHNKGRTLSVPFNMNMGSSFNTNLKFNIYNNKIVFQVAKKSIVLQCLTTSVVKTQAYL